MKVEILKQPNSSITKDLSNPIELDNYTILAGENNAGKSNIIRAIKEHRDIKDVYEVIEIPAEKNNPKDEEVKTSAKSPFYEIIKKILDPLFSNSMLDELVKNFDKSETKKEFVDNININLKKLGVDKKEFNIK